MQSFIDAIRDDKPTKVSGNDGLAPVLIAIAAKESLKTGKPVKVDSL
jgi:myo-inositol 2-dehydrogenase/D-chiro-inositol 1-dehydrogenase